MDCFPKRRAPIICFIIWSVFLLEKIKTAPYYDDWSDEPKYGDCLCGIDHSESLEKSGQEPFIHYLLEPDSECNSISVSICYHGCKNKIPLMLHKYCENKSYIEGKEIFMYYNLCDARKWKSIGNGKKGLKICCDDNFPTDCTGGYESTIDENYAIPSDEGTTVDNIYDLDEIATNRRLTFHKSLNRYQRHSVTDEANSTIETDFSMKSEESQIREDTYRGRPVENIVGIETNRKTSIEYPVTVIPVVTTIYNQLSEKEFAENPGIRNLINSTVKHGLATRNNFLSANNIGGDIRMNGNYFDENITSEPSEKISPVVLDAKIFVKQKGKANLINKQQEKNETPQNISNESSRYNTYSSKNVNKVNYYVSNSNTGREPVITIFPAEKVVTETTAPKNFPMKQIKNNSRNDSIIGSIKSKETTGKDKKLLNSKTIKGSFIPDFSETEIANSSFSETGSKMEKPLKNYSHAKRVNSKIVNNTLTTKDETNNYTKVIDETIPKSYKTQKQTKSDSRNTNDTSNYAINNRTKHKKLSVIEILRLICTRSIGKNPRCKNLTALEDNYERASKKFLNKHRTLKTSTKTQETAPVKHSHGHEKHNMKVTSKPHKIRKPTELVSAVTESITARIAKEYSAGTEKQMDDITKKSSIKKYEEISDSRRHGIPSATKNISTKPKARITATLLFTDRITKPTTTKKRTVTKSTTHTPLKLTDIEISSDPSSVQGKETEISTIPGETRFTNRNTYSAEILMEESARKPLDTYRSKEMSALNPIIGNAVHEYSTVNEKVEHDIYNKSLKSKEEARVRSTKTKVIITDPNNCTTSSSEKLKKSFTDELTTSKHIKNDIILQSSSFKTKRTIRTTKITPDSLPPIGTIEITYPEKEKLLAHSVYRKPTVKRVRNCTESDLFAKKNGFKTITTTEENILRTEILTSKLSDRANKDLSTENVPSVVYTRPGKLDREIGMKSTEGKLSNTYSTTPDRTAPKSSREQFKRAIGSSIKTEEKNTSSPRTEDTVSMEEVFRNSGKREGEMMLKISNREETYFEKPIGIKKLSGISNTIHWSANQIDDDVINKPPGVVNGNHVLKPSSVNGEINPSGKINSSEIFIEKLTSENEAPKVMAVGIYRRKIDTDFELKAVPRTEEPKPGDIVISRVQDENTTGQLLLQRKGSKPSDKKGDWIKNFDSDDEENIKVQKPCRYNEPAITCPTEKGVLVTEPYNSARPKNIKPKTWVRQINTTHKNEKKGAFRIMELRCGADEKCKSDVITHMRIIDSLTAGDTSADPVLLGTVPREPNSSERVGTLEILKPNYTDYRSNLNMESETPEFIIIKDKTGDILSAIDGYNEKIQEFKNTTPAIDDFGLQSLLYLIY